MSRMKFDEIKERMGGNGWTGVNFTESRYRICHAICRYHLTTL